MTIGLIDCNAFYVSCQVLFAPWLRDKAVAVASSNDGCVVSRNDPAKGLGVKAGQPIFELRQLIERGDLIVFSSNFALYQSLSNKVMAIIDEWAPRSFLYSIDEKFVVLTGVSDPEEWGHAVKHDIQQRLGMPVGVGIGQTKTLAKIASWTAKKWKQKTGCVTDLSDPDRAEKVLKRAPVSEVWGIGGRLTERLSQEMGIRTAWQLATADPKILRRTFSVNVERTARELRGVTCFAFDDAPTRKKMILCSRSFGTKIYSLNALQEAVASFVSNAATKLRAQGSLTNCIQVFARTSPFDNGTPYAGTRIIALPYPTDDTRDLLQAAMFGIANLYRDGTAFAKAGIVLTQFVERGSITGDLFAPAPRHNSDQLMHVMDGINAKFGRGSLRLAREKPVGLWTMRRELLSPAYTTAWQDLPAAKCV